MPSCITRALPEPTSGLPAATSGVAHSQPNAPCADGSKLELRAIRRAVRIGDMGKTLTQPCRAGVTGLRGPGVGGELVRE